MAIGTLQFPLRGLASDGAQAIVERALEQLPGIQGIAASMVNNLLQIDYDDERVSEQRIHDALRQAGIVHGAHGLAD